MRIAFVGKGGSGKTTLSALMARYLVSKSLPVLAIDADINQHLAQSLGHTTPLKEMGNEITKIKEHLRGTNAYIGDYRAMIKTTPPGVGSTFMRVNESNPIYDYFAVDAQGVRLMAVGQFTEEDLGISCYHSKTGAVELVLNHLIDRENEYVIVDMTAGADAFASGLFTKFDVTFLVVEPTHKSVSVYEQYKQYAKDYNVEIKVIGNKVENEDDLQFLVEHIGSDLVAALGHSRFVKSSDRGEQLKIEELEVPNADALEKIIEAINKTKKDWPKFYKQAAEFHTKNALSWANKAAGKDLTEQIDREFTENPEKYIGIA